MKNYIGFCPASQEDYLGGIKAEEEEEEEKIEYA